MNELVEYVCKADKVYYAVEVAFGNNPHGSCVVSRNRPM
jgi:hypothetical protein